MFSLCIPLLSFIASPCIYPFYKTNVCNRYNIINSNSVDLLESLTPPSGGELKLLTHLNGAAWAQNWLLHMGKNDTQLYDEHYCTECLRMKQASEMYTSEEYFYFGFY